MMGHGLICWLSTTWPPSGAVKSRGAVLENPMLDPRLVMSRMIREAAEDDTAETRRMFREDGAV